MARSVSSRLVLVIGATFLVIGIYYTFGQSGTYVEINDRIYIYNKDTLHVEYGYDIPKLRQSERKSCSPDLREASYFSQSNEDKALYDKFFSSPPLCGGVYVEIGALDGVTYSNTKFFETSLNWTGVLIEAQPQNAALLKKNRNTHNNVIIPEAVCRDHHGFVNFTGSDAVGGVASQLSKLHTDIFFTNKQMRLVEVPCRPMGDMLRDAGVTSVDFFILDVEGAELMVLETMDWSIPVRLFVVEMGRGDKDRLLVDFLAKHGYRKSAWNIREYCLENGDCTNNQVFENIQFTAS